MTREQFDAALERNYAYLVQFVNSYGKDWYAIKPKEYLHDTIVYFIEQNRYERIREDDERGFRGCLMKKFLYTLYNKTDSALDQKFEDQLEDTLSTWDKLYFDEPKFDDVAGLVSHYPSPLESLLATEEQQVDIEEIDELVYYWNRLPTKLQELIELVVIDGLTHAEIAKEWGVSRQQITKLWGQALQTLREHLREHNEGDSYDESS